MGGNERGTSRREKVAGTKTVIVTCNLAHKNTVHTPVHSPSFFFKKGLSISRSTRTEQTKGSEFQLQSEWSRRQRGTSVCSEYVSVEHTQRNAWEDGADVWRTWKSFTLNMWHGFSQKKLCLTTNKYLMFFTWQKPFYTSVVFHFSSEIQL